jgi:TRAP-type C4-dicarboxylate transport system permease small subunit
MLRIRGMLNGILKLLAGGSFLAMVGLTCWQVFTRYILKNPSSWSEELVSYLFAWMTLLGASLVVGERGHMNIPILVERTSPETRKGLAIFGEVVAAVFAGVILVYGGIQITTLALGQMTSSLEVPVGVFYVVLPLSGVLNVIYTVLNIVGISNGTIELSSAADVKEEPINEEVKVVVEEAEEQERRSYNGD